MGAVVPVTGRRGEYAVLKYAAPGGPAHEIGVLLLDAATGKLCARLGEDWVRAPEGIRLAEGMFVAHVVGRSMEPRIPDGSVSVFRARVVGSRQGRIVLVELLTEREEAGRYTVKKYTSSKRRRDDGGWEHEAITLLPLNPEFEQLRLEPGELKVIAEWVTVLD